MVLPVTFNGNTVAQLLVPDGTRHVRELMGQDEMQVVIESPTPINLPINSYTTIDGWRYTINTIPSPKVGDDGSVTRYTYKITFEAPFYKLYDKRLRHLNNKTFSITGDLSEMAYLIVANINEIDQGWSVGVVENMGIKQVDFDQHSCRTAMDKVAEVFGCEWYASGVDGKTINFVKQVGNLTSLVLDYGRGNGLYELGFEYQNDKNIVTRAYGYGGVKNLPPNYRGKAEQLIFDGFCLDKNTDLYGIKEGDSFDKDIYPTFTGTVGATSAYDAGSPTFTLTDNSIFFDLNTYFSPDTPKLIFQSGQLMNQTFDISTYNHGTKTLVLNKANDAAGNTLPGSVVAVAVGDKYTLIDMYMPDEVVAEAEQKLREKTQEYLNENCVPRVLYSLELDPLFMRDHGVMLHPGDQIRVRHSALGIDNLIRVTAVDYPASFPEELPPGTKITATIANFIPYTTTERVIADTIDNQKEIRTVDRVNAERARQNAANMKKLQGRIFNPDGSLFTGVNSLVAGMVSVGFDSQNFNLNGVTISANNGADPNALAISGGTLTHYTYKIDGLGYIWAIAPRNWTGLSPTAYYYLYAKCSTSSLTGTWELSETPVSVGAFAGYWVFNVGILYEVNDAGYRDFDFTKGTSDIVGDTIKTGALVSKDGQNYLNLNNGKFNLGNAASGIDWDVTNPGVMTIRGAIASDVIRIGENTVISGLNDPDDVGKSIRFASGPNGEFIILDNGKAYMTDAYIKGTINAESGQVGNWQIYPNGLTHIGEDDAYIIQRKTDAAGNTIAEAMIGTNILPASSGVRAVGYFSNEELNPFGTNYGIFAKASGGNKNIAIQSEGSIVQNGGDITVNGKKGLSTTLDIRVSGGSGFATFTWVNGILTSIVQQ